MQDMLRQSRREVDGHIHSFWVLLSWYHYHLVCELPIVSPRLLFFISRLAGTSDGRAQW